MESEDSQASWLSALAAFWRPRGINPNESLKGEKPEEYRPWKYAVNAKLETDTPLYPTDKAKVRYALSQMKEPIFSAIQDWVADSENATYSDLLDKVEHYMGFHLQQQQAKKDLQTISQQSNKAISAYYH